jgi:hypothetical protein
LVLQQRFVAVVLGPVRERVRPPLIIGVKTEDPAVAAGHSVDPPRWQDAFEGLMNRIAGRFVRVEPRRRVGRLVLGLLSDLPRKNCWTIAEWAGESTPDGMQHLLSRARWDADAVRDDMRG